MIFAASSSSTINIVDRKILFVFQLHELNIQQLPTVGIPSTTRLALSRIEILARMSSSLLRHPLLHTSLILAAIGGSTYNSRQHHLYQREEEDARFDEIEGTLRGHIGLIEDSLDRLEGKTTSGIGTPKQDALYNTRFRDEKNKGKDGEPKK